MASTPVKTSQVDRFAPSFAGTSANADATKLKGRASPESVRHFESLLDATNRAAPAEKPASKPAARNANRAEEASKASSKSETPSTVVKSDADKKVDVSDEADLARAANIAEAKDAAIEDAAVTNVTPAPAADDTATAPTPPTESTDETTAPPPAATESNPTAIPVIAAPLPTPPLPVTVEALPVQAASPSPAGAVQAVPAEIDLSQQEPVVLPQTVIEDALATVAVPALTTAAAPAPEEVVAVPQLSEAAPGVAPAQTSTPTESTTPPSTPQASATSAQQATPAQTNANSNTNPADAIIETLTVVAPEAAPAAVAPTAKAENAPAQQAADASVETQAQPAAPQTAVVVAEAATPKAKAPTAKPQAEAVPQQDAETLSGLPKGDAAPAPATETKQDQSRQDQSPAERGRERAQERAQAGERLAARFADSQVSLIRDEASLSGPIQTFKATLKAAAVDANLNLAAAASPSDAPKASTTASVTATVVNNATTTNNATPAARTASRSNAPLYQTPVVQQVGTRLVETVANGGGRVIMDLRPEHLGRVTIDVDVRDDGRVTATVLVDNPEALEQLRRDAGQLEQALRDTGLNPEQNSLNFALREQAQENGGFGREGRRGRDANGDLLADAEIEPEIAAPTKQSVVPGMGVIDIRI